MKKSTEITTHIFFWILFTCFIFMLSKIYLQVKPDAPFSRHLIWVVFLELIMGLIFFYTTFFGIPWARKKKGNMVIFSAFLLTLLIFFAYPATRSGFWEVMSSIVPHIIIIFLALGFRKFSDSVKLEREKRVLMLQNTKSELALLKMQISPHFLFNTLNNIDYLISADKTKASVSISKLGDILRYMIYEAKSEKIPLSKEIKHIEDYIDLILLRTSGLNYLNYHLTGHSGHLQIAPMLFLPLIENAYKHSSRKEGENIINIDMKIDENDLYLIIDNEYDISRAVTTPETEGIGFNIVKRRLELIYPDKHTIIVSQYKNRFNIKLTLTLDEY